MDALLLATTNATFATTADVLLLCDADIALTVALRRVANAECFGLSKVPTGAVSARPVCSTLLLHSASGHWQCPLAACALIEIWAGHTGQRVTLPAHWRAECDSPVSGSVRALCTCLLARAEKGTPFSAKQAGRLLPLWQRTSLPGARVRPRALARRSIATELGVGQPAGVISYLQ